MQHTGSSVNPQRQKEPHAHYINVDPTDRFAYVADLGLDKILIYRFDAAKGTLTPNDPPFASGEARLGSTAPRDGCEGPLRVPHQRDGLHDHGVQPGRRSRVD